MPLTLQSSSESIGEVTLDAVTLLLLAGFVISMLTLAVLFRNHEPAAPDEHPAPEMPEPARMQTAAPIAAPSSAPDPIQPRAASPPAWLTGVSFASTGGQLSDACSVIERLLDARREKNLTGALSLCTPAYRAKLAADLGISPDNLGLALSAAQLDGDPPEVRSVELVSVQGEKLHARAGYTDGTAEIYHMVRVEGCWAIDAIDGV